MDANISIVQENIAVSGSLNFKNVVKIWRKSLGLFPDTPQFSIDLKDVTNCDSAGLCLLIEWLKWAKSKDKMINFKNLPDQLDAMAKLAGVADLVNAQLGQLPPPATSITGSRKNV